MRVARHAGNGARRHTALGDLVSLVALVLTRSVRRDQLAAIDRRMEVEFLRIDAEPPFGKQQIAQHDSRTLEAVSNIEYFRDQLEAVADVERSGNDPRVVAEGRAQHLPQIALLGL